MSWANALRCESGEIRVRLLAALSALCLVAAAAVAWGLAQQGGQSVARSGDGGKSHVAVSSTGALVAPPCAWPPRTRPKAGMAGLVGCEPSCSWPLRIRDRPYPGEAGLVRCYLQALATGDIDGLYWVALPNDGGNGHGRLRFTKPDLAYAAAARSGLATATFAGNGPGSPDTAWTFLTIAYANGTRQDIGIQDISEAANINTGYLWRLTIGTEVSPGPPRIPSSG